MIEKELKKTEALPAYDVGGKNDLTPSENALRLLGDHLMNRFNKIKGVRERSEWESEKARAFLSYHLVPKQRPLPYPGAANFPSPFPRIGVDAFHSNVMASMFVEGHRMKVVPILTQKDFVNTAQKAATFMTFVMNHEAGAYDAIDDADKKAQMYGIGYLEPHYVKESRWETIETTETKNVPEIDPVTQQVVVKEVTQKKREKKKRTTFDGVKIDSIPVEAVYVSPFFKSLEEAVRDDIVIKVFSRPFDAIIERSKSKDDSPTFYIKSQVDKLKPFVIDKARKNWSELEQAKANVDGFFLDYLCERESLDLAQGYLWWDIDGDGIKEEITATFHRDSGTVLRVSLSKCRLVELKPRPIDDRFYGEGIPRICTELDNEWETFHNTRANAGQWENTTFGFYRAGGRFNPRQITIQPGQFYPVDDPREVVFAQVPRTGASYFQEEQLMWSIFERILALDENIQGVSSRRARSATETINVTQRASIRFGNPFNRTVMSVNRLLNHIWELNVECAPLEKEFYIVGTEGNPMFSKMEKKDYAASLQFAISVLSTFDQQLTRDTMLLAYRLYLTNPLIQQHPETLWDLSQKTLDMLDVKVDIPKPDQAKTLTPYEEHELFQIGEVPEPQVGEDVDHHLKVHMAQFQSESIKDWEPEAVRSLILHIDKTKILKGTLESTNLNKSGIFNGMGMGPQPSLTINRNPTQPFNTKRVAETGNSARQNLKNGMGPQNVEQNISSILNQPVS